MQVLLVVTGPIRVKKYHPILMQRQLNTGSRGVAGFKP